MICRRLTINNEQEWLENSKWLASRTFIDNSIEDTVREIQKNVLSQRDEALIQYTQKFDCPEFNPPIRVDEQEIARAAACVNVESRDELIAAASNIRVFHEAQIEKSWFITKDDGSILGQRVLPVDAVGLYVPGGQGGNTPLISTLLMNAIPAQVAGVPRIAICTPARKDGTINPHILAAAHLLDIDEVYRVGGAWSIFALAYGTQSIAPVDVIAGPGNIYVTTAKKIVQGHVGIDMLAGPSEVLILADSSTDISYLAADMLSQAEHDNLASAICITDSAKVADNLATELEKQCSKLPKSHIASKSLLDWGAIIKTPNMDVAIDIANHIAPEHLEICTENAWDLMPKLKHAGAIFIGQHSPEAVGDYFAGPNHVLPTLGTARFSSALSVQTFCKKTSIVATSKTFLEQNCTTIMDLARLENLEAHARSIQIRCSNISNTFGDE